MNKIDWHPLQEKLSKMTIKARQEWLEKLSPGDREVLRYYPEVFLDSFQIIPEGNWFYHWFQGCRGSGKTFSSLIWLWGKIRDGAEEVAIVGPDHPTLKKEIIPFLLKLFPKSPTKTDLTNGIIEYDKRCLIKLYSSEYEIRGCNAEYGVAEEMAKWCQCQPNLIKERWTVFNAGVRNPRAKPPQIVIASTPKPFDFFRDFETKCKENHPNYSRTKTNIDQVRFISEAKKQALKDELSGSRIGLQELYAEILDDNPNALWSESTLEKNRISTTSFNNLINARQLIIARVIITIDPAVSTNKNSDETGIIVACLCDNNHVYIMEDKSGKIAPAEWAKEAVKQYHDYQASAIIMESNQGGNLLEMAIMNVNPYVRTKLIHASVGKSTKFEPVCVAYERGEVHHVGKFHDLEKQMISWDPYNTKDQKSPDRADAVALAVYELLLTQQLPTLRSSKAFGSR
jgi:phage terminase large subunit-like protein